MTPTYQQQTINARNPIARFAHRNRVAKSVNISRGLLPPQGSLLDYGCGDGTFIKAMGDAGFKSFGYEPFMEGVATDRIHSDFKTIISMGEKHDLITVFETIEHLSEGEIIELLSRARAVMAPHGKILFSAPIEIGPALLLKSLNREWRSGESGLKVLTRSLFAAAVFGVAETRAVNIKISHQGFDFRKALAFLRANGCAVSIITYGPLPIKTWYGNSQVYFIASL